MNVIPTFYNLNFVKIYQIIRDLLLFLQGLIIACKVILENIPLQCRLHHFHRWRRYRRSDDCTFLCSI